MELRERIAAVRRPASTAVEDEFSEVRDRVHSALIADLGPQLANTELEPHVLRERVRVQARARLAEERDSRAPTASAWSTRSPTTRSATARSRSSWPTTRSPRSWSTGRWTSGSSAAGAYQTDGALQRRRAHAAHHQQDRQRRSAGGSTRRRRWSTRGCPTAAASTRCIPPLSLSGPLLTIRKFAKRELRPRRTWSGWAALIAGGGRLARACACAASSTSSSPAARAPARRRCSTRCPTAIPDNERIVTIEDAAELRLNQRHVLRLEARPANIEGEGEVAIRDLVRNALRMRPDRIIVGEVRGAEALDMLQAMNTGHDGSLTTVHANSPRDALARVETMVLMAGYDLPMRAIRQQIASAVDLIVHVERLPDGSRRVTAITEVMRTEGDVITTGDLFTFHVDEISDDGTVSGGLRWTGLRPTFVAKLERHGLALPGALAGSAHEAPDRVAKIGLR